MKVSPISLLNLSASMSSCWLPSADLTAEVTMSLSLILLPGGLGPGGDCLADTDVHCLQFYMVTSPGSGFMTAL